MKELKMNVNVSFEKYKKGYIKIGNKRNEI